MRAIPLRPAAGWGVTAAAALASAWAAGLALQAHALNAALAVGWCGVDGHVAEQGLLGHCAPCWAAGAAAVLALGAGLRALHRGRRG